MSDKATRENAGLFFRDVEMPGGWSHNLQSTLKRINLYYNGKFETGERDNRGFKKFFYNITKPSCDVAEKFIDLDTKDIILYHESSDNEWPVWMMMQDLKR